MGAQNLNERFDELPFYPSLIHYGWFIYIMIKIIIVNVSIRKENLLKMEELPKMTH